MLLNLGEHLWSGKLAKEANLREVHHILVEIDAVEPIYDESDSAAADEEDEEEADGA